MDLAMREWAITFVDVIMRVPPLFVIDELLRISPGFSGQNSEVEKMANDNFTMMNVSDSFIGVIATTTSEQFLQHFSLNAYQIHFMTAFKVLAYFFGFFASLCMFLHIRKHLAFVYMYLFCVGLIFSSYWTNIIFFKQIDLYLNAHEGVTSILEEVLSLNLKDLMQCGMFSIFLQACLSQFLVTECFFCINRTPRHPLIHKLFFIVVITPLILGFLPLSKGFLHQTPVLATLFTLCLFKYFVWHHRMSILMAIKADYAHVRNFVRNYGLSALVEAEWNRLNVPCVLRTFWLLRVLEQVIQMMGNQYHENTFTFYLMMLRTLLVNGCETLTSLLGMTSIISLICHYIGTFFRWVLLTADEDDKNMGTVSAILFYILALQTGLTSLDREKRLLRLYRNFCLLFTAILHFVHNTVNPLLMSLSASHNPALHRHLRALAVCTFLILFPTSLLIFLWSNFTISTWMLAVSVFSIEVIVKVLVSLSIYFLFLFDAYRSIFWEQLDDCVYIIRSFGNTVEFAFGVILFFNGLWILVFESGGAIRAVMMCIHAYFNIYCEATAGWNIFMKRRAAVNKINSLPEANAEQLETLNDVCAICYQEMQTAKITRCSHYFHGVCLRKWLYVQDRCPLCHDILYKVENKNKTTTDTRQQDANDNPLVEEIPENNSMLDNREQ